ncbi:zinc finger CCCH domain-containing protein 11A-like [Portunus trituberculatus]|uniref:zinc finger CCCH domain-containing protein 11A-like n=1 Tax=Portunus trituberculatus TaxID=210409 RepID=UPI001E1CEA7C|nr:zinc finger CCCH domain-containing protein 11A-like [Portunus trituberculatus]
MGERIVKESDCYFYYYSSCSKGESCNFRHEPSALRNETVCVYWKSGKCTRDKCIFPHMDITKQRDRIACYFETQPGGCRKPHCPFQHSSVKTADDLPTDGAILPVKAPSTPPPASAKGAVAPQKTSVIVALHDGKRLERGEWVGGRFEQENV